MSSEIFADIENKIKVIFQVACVVYLHETNSQVFKHSYENKTLKKNAEAIWHLMKSFRCKQVTKQY